jgi:hypothetical protein
MSPIYVPGKVVLRKGWQPMDPDAAAYITAVETADTEPLEEKTKIAIDNFVLGCKEDGIWTAIKASCILSGARTLAGALVPLAGTAPTNVNFVSGDYNRKTGLVGNGSTKYLNSNRAGNADPQDNFHAFAWLPSQTLVNEDIARQLIASVGNTWVGYNTLVGGVSQYFIRARQASSSVINFATNNVISPVGVSRSTSSAITVRANGTSSSVSIASATAGSPSFFVLAANDGSGAIQHSSARLAFYSIGESLDLALLDTRVTDLINAFAAAIP